MTWCSIRQPRALLDTACVSALFGMSRYLIRQWTESGELAVAFDVRRRSVSRSELRIWWPCILAKFHQESQPLPSIAEVVDSLFQLGTDPRRCSVYRALSISHWHCIGLEADGLLQAYGRSSPGQHGSPRIRRTSLVAFLTARRVGA